MKKIVPLLVAIILFSSCSYGFQPLSVPAWCHGRWTGTTSESDCTLESVEISEGDIVITRRMTATMEIVSTSINEDYLLGDWYIIRAGESEAGSVWECVIGNFLSSTNMTIKVVKSGESGLLMTIGDRHSADITFTLSKEI